MNSDYLAGGDSSETVQTVMSLDDLKSYLASKGFHISRNPMRDEFNDCDWYAYRRSEIDARACECNSDKKGAQLVVTPNSFSHTSIRHESVEVEITGEFGVWWNLKAYGISMSELPKELDAIEASLIAAWNALELS